MLQIVLLTRKQPNGIYSRIPIDFSFTLVNKSSVNHAEHTVTTDRNRIIPYDICVLATGSVAILPPYIATERAKQTRGVFVYRNIADLEAIMNYAEREGAKGEQAAVVSGGLLGLRSYTRPVRLPLRLARSMVIHHHAHAAQRFLMCYHC
jgi:nitrite reductase (NAD(P)H)